MAERYQPIGIFERVVKTLKREMPVAPAKYRSPQYEHSVLDIKPNPLIITAIKSELPLPQPPEMVRWKDEFLEVEATIGERVNGYSLPEHATMRVLGYRTDAYYPVKSYLVRGLKSGVTLHLVGNGNAQYRMFWTPNEYIDGFHQPDFRGTDSRVHIFSPNIAHPGVMVVALHEIGHHYSLMQSDKKNTARMTSLSNARLAIRSSMFISTDELGLVLEEERTAWSYAMAKLRPFIRAGDWSGLNIQTLTSLVYKVALNSYHYSIAKKLTTPPSFFPKLT